MIKLNPDSIIVYGIRKGLERSDGFCPCKPEHIGEPDYLCPCKDFREEKKCCCELYIEVE